MSPFGEPLHGLAAVRGSPDGPVRGQIEELARQRDPLGRSRHRALWRPGTADAAGAGADADADLSWRAPARNRCPSRARGRYGPRLSARRSLKIVDVRESGILSGGTRLCVRRQTAKQPQCRGCRPDSEDEEQY